jgi:FKBP12-rapamycin complex-associated protein
MLRMNMQSCTALQGRSSCPEALHCVGVLATALREAWRPHCQPLLEGMVLTGLSETLVEALTAVSDAEG